MSVAVKTGQVVIASTGTAVAIPAATTPNGLIIKTKASNNATGMFVGDLSTVNNTDDGTGAGYKLSPGEAISIGGGTALPASTVYISGTTGDVAYYIWS